MVRYFYKCLPLAALAAVVLLSMPWLGVIALIVVAVPALVALAALAWTIATAPYRLVLAFARQWHDGGATSRRKPTLPPSPSVVHVIGKG
jgi:hypothetical protein